MTEDQIIDLISETSDAYIDLLDDPAAIAIADDKRRTCPTHGYLAPQFDPSTCTCPPGD